MVLMTYVPLATVLENAGCSEFADRMTYQDYLYELCGAGYEANPMSEQQWEAMCDLLGKRKPIYASTVKAAIENLVRKAKDKE